MSRVLRVFAVFAAIAALPAIAAAEDCAIPGALGTSRTITVNPDDLPHIGVMQYSHSLPLDDHEVVITFDDGPLAPYSNRVLDALAAECVKVNYFMVGTMARANPALVRRIYNAGHVIGTHSLRHPLRMDHMNEARVADEIDGGIAAVKAALGDEHALAPFFRVPGLARSTIIENHAAEEKLAVWSADEVADDWHRGITPAQIVQRAIARIEGRGHRGILLLHDIHPATATALPMLLKRLKAEGYKIVQAVPAGERPATLPEPTPAEIAAQKQAWPRVVETEATSRKARLAQTSKHQASKHEARKHAADTHVAGKMAALRLKLASHKTESVADTAPTFSAVFNR